MNSQWLQYSEIGGRASYSVPTVGEQYRGKGFNLAQWYREYDWVADHGYDHFATWVG